MPVPELHWKSYEVPADAGDPPRSERGLRSAAAAEAPVGVVIPVLKDYQGPLDKAKVLLQIAAEVEHALLVQYLYAAFSLKSPGELSGGLDDSQRSAVHVWDGELRHIAKQEMGHLMTAQNLLLALGLPPNLGRDEFPPIQDLYPFKLHLEPLSQRSLAKYVTAEAPQDAPDITEITDLAADTEHHNVNHVGNIYGLLGVIFSTHHEVESGESGTSSWDQHLRFVEAAAYKQNRDPEAWHLHDSPSPIDTGSLAFQANPRDWMPDGPDVTIYPISNRAEARKAIREIAEQGEGPTDSGKASHFERFLRIYKGDAPKKLPPFPAENDAWKPALEVPRDPAEPPKNAANRTERWLQLANQRYELLLGFIGHYLLTSVTDDRALLASWAQQEMFILNDLRNKLVTLPLGGGVAAPPFTLPHPLELPPNESERWEKQRARTQDAINHIRAMQADPADAHDPTLTNLLDTETEHLTQMGQRGGGTRPPTTSFDRDVKPLFGAKDRDHMLDEGLDLTNYDAVRGAATEISNRIKGIGGRRMPPPPDPPLTDDQIKLFDAWVAEGSPP